MLVGVSTEAGVGYGCESECKIGCRCWTLQVSVGVEGTVAGVGVGAGLRVIGAGGINALNSSVHGVAAYTTKTELVLPKMILVGLRPLPFLL